MANADVGAIAAAAGVARDTFYFHFPTKELVLLRSDTPPAMPLRDRPIRKAQP